MLRTLLFKELSYLHSRWDRKYCLHAGSDKDDEWVFLEAPPLSLSVLPYLNSVFPIILPIGMRWDPFSVLGIIQFPRKLFENPPTSNRIYLALVYSALRTLSTVLAKGIHVSSVPTEDSLSHGVTTPLLPFWLKKSQHHLVVINDFTQIIFIRLLPFDKHLLNSYPEPGLTGTLKNTCATQLSKA